MDISIVCKSVAGEHAFLRKEFESDIIPIPGMFIEDTAWKKPRKPAEITCNFDGQYYHVQFEDVEIQKPDALEREAEMYRGHGWKSPSEWGLH